MPYSYITDSTKKLLKDILLYYIIRMAPKACTKCFDVQPLTEYHIKGVREDKSLRYDSHCKRCKYAYNVEYLKKKRQEPEFQAKERAYLLYYSSGVRKAHLKTNWEALRPQT
jgi:hypothetical protein